ncbi:hypothetical protein JZ751_028816 [Albula glossodonta]|uniref:ATP-dependent Clp protease proteolytic subunit n=1 Tax=Albula glossodonta TaxID=121402 RepID=A0A8T2NAP4_9TELE|nr:hypothetical protein JZ751_028816 [Albula glossodonta]
MEAQDFGIIDKVLVHPPLAGKDEPELVQKETPLPAASSSPTSPQPPTSAQSLALSPGHKLTNPSLLPQTRALSPGHKLTTPSLLLQTRALSPGHKLTTERQLTVKPQNHSSSVR